jgi:hypothetical protein
MMRVRKPIGSWLARAELSIVRQTAWSIDSIAPSARAAVLPTRPAKTHNTTA